MIAALLALAASALYGTADFLGGMASRRAAVLMVAAVSQVAGLAALLLVMPLLPPSVASGADLAWGAATGVAGAVGLALFYRALSVGRMSVVAPIGAAVGNAIPVLVGVALGERPGALVYLGMLLAIASIVLVSQEDPRSADATDATDAASPALRAGASHTQSILLALGAGVGIGLFYACLGRTSPASGLRPLVVARSVALIALFAVARARGTSLRLAKPALIGSLCAGVIDIAANACYLLAVHQGLLSVVATLSSLYPAATLLLARVVLSERLRRVQVAGLGVGALAITLITAG